MLLRYSLGLEKEAKAVEDAVQRVLESGARTGDIAEPGEGARKIRAPKEVSSAGYRGCSAS